MKCDYFGLPDYQSFKCAECICKKECVDSHNKGKIPVFKKECVGFNESEVVPGWCDHYKTDGYCSFLKKIISMDPYRCDDVKE